jgi:Domain of unknown function (DUF4189)
MTDAAAGVHRGSWQRGRRRREGEKMKTIYGFVVLATLAFPSASFAGWGAIAYNSSTGASGESHGHGSQAEAENAALKLCGGGCSIINSEENSCIALATSARRWGEGHGYATQEEAVNAAHAACNVGCILKEWACN